MLVNESTHVKLTQVPWKSSKRKAGQPEEPARRTRESSQQYMSRGNVQNGLIHRGVPRYNQQSTSEPGCNYGRPPFITTVTRGKFLPSKFDLKLSERTLYTYSSRPRPLAASKHQCSLFSTPSSNNSQNSAPRGVHDYFNLMWDPHIRRGNTGTGVRVALQKEEIVEAKSSSQLNSQDPTSPPKVRKKRSSNLFSSRSSSRYRIQRATTPPPPKGHLTALVQTDAFIEYLTDTGGHATETDVTVQTEPIHDRVTPPPPPWIPAKTGVDASTEILPGELSNFDDELQPIVATLVAKIIEQSLVEVMEEEELSAIREQQRRFEQKKGEEERELRLLQEQHERISAEKERLKKHLESRQVVVIQPASVNEKSTERSSSGGVVSGGPVYTTSDLLELLPSVLDSLRQEGFLSDGAGDDAFAQLSAVINSGSAPLSANKEMILLKENNNPQETYGENGGSSPVELDPPSWTALENLENKELEEQEETTKSGQ